MATLTFNCPNCGSICAFKDNCSGRCGRCLTCGQRFVIPADSNQKIEEIKTEEILDTPLPGFYQAVFKRSFFAVFNLRSLTTILFVFAATLFKFFTAHIDYSFKVGFNSGGGFTVHLEIGWWIAVLAWGGLFWCYSEIVYATAFDSEVLPMITFEGGLGYFFKVLKSFYSFFIALLVCLLPYILARFVFCRFGITSQFVSLPFLFIGMFLFPMCVLALSISRDLVELFRFDRFCFTIRHCFKDYFFVAAVFLLIWHLQAMTNNYGDVAGGSKTVIWLNVFYVLAVQMLIIWSMRIAGLFYRHFVCYFRF